MKVHTIIFVRLSYTNFRPGLYFTTLLGQAGLGRVGLAYPNKTLGLKAGPKFSLAQPNYFWDRLVEHRASPAQLTPLLKIQIWTGNFHLFGLVVIL